MRLLSVNVGQPREIEWQGDLVRTSIYKSPVPDRRRVRTLNVDGDAQSDLTVHGGLEKAVYAYPSEHYAFWSEQLLDADLPLGVFGENLTTEGLFEDRICSGDLIRCGDVEFEVSQPRLPCYKLGLRFQRLDMVKRFQQAGRPGFYLRVRREGDVGVGDRLEHVAAEGDRISIAELARVYVATDADPQLLQRASELPSLSPGWRSHFRKRLETR